MRQPDNTLDAEDLLRRLGLAIKRINALENQQDFLNAKFIETMNDIGRYGFEKYGALPRNRAEHRNPRRARAAQIAEHAEDHFDHYLRGIPHDHFNTRRHQLAAVAYNAMMEFILAGLDSDPWEL